MANTNQKLNRSGNSHAGKTIRIITHGFFGEEKLSAAERVIINALYTFAQKGSAADFTYTELKRRYNISYATVARTIPKILQLCFERGEAPHSYKLKEILPAPERYFYTPDWLFFAQFPAGTSTTDLTNDQIDVLAYILHQNGTLRHWTSTQASIARTLGIAPSTVSEAISRFENLGILTVKCAASARSRSANHYDRATFTVNDSLIDQIRKETVKHIKALPHAVRDADARTDRERFYAARQDLAHAHEKKVRAELGDALEEIERQIRQYELDIAKAVSEKHKQKILELMEERKKIVQAKREFLEAHGYTEGDLEPRYICPLCNDTGWNKKTNRACTCYTPPGGTL